MQPHDSRTLLVEARLLITATRLRIARSTTLLAQVALEGSIAHDSAQWGSPERGVPPSTPTP